MRVALDSNIILYAEGIDDEGRRHAASDLIARLRDVEIMIPVQVIGEVFNVLVRRGGQTRSAAFERCREWIDIYATIDTSADVIKQAAELAALHELSIWDAVVVQCSATAGCRLLLSEDMHNGFSWRGTTIANPFAEPVLPALSSVLS